MAISWPNISDNSSSLSTPSLSFSTGAIAPVFQGVLFVEASRSHLDTPHSVGLLWVSDQSVAETSACKTHTHMRQIFLVPPEFEPAIPASEWPQTHALDCAAAGIGIYIPLPHHNVTLPLK
jgi:hypothetical protein